MESLDIILESLNKLETKIDSANSEISKLKTEVALINRDKKWIATISGIIGSIVAFIFTTFIKPN